MPRKRRGVYSDGHGGWYFKVSLGRDPLSGRHVQVTKRGYRSATEAGRARQELLKRADARRVKVSSKVLTVDELLDLYLDRLDADGRYQPKPVMTIAHVCRPFVRSASGVSTADAPWLSTPRGTVLLCR